MINVCVLAGLLKGAIELFGVDFVVNQNIENSQVLWRNRIVCHHFGDRHQNLIRVWCPIKFFDKYVFFDKIKLFCSKFLVKYSKMSLQLRPIPS